MISFDPGEKHHPVNQVCHCENLHLDMAAVEFHDIHRGEVELAKEGVHALPALSYPISRYLPWDAHFKPINDLSRE
jgi:hypothetical protein